MRNSFSFSLSCGPSEVNILIIFLVYVPPHKLARRVQEEVEKKRD